VDGRAHIGGDQLGSSDWTGFRLALFLWVVTLHAPRVAAALHNGNEWISLFVALAMSGGAFLVAGSMPPRN
jgi:hypothetical protein